MSRYIFVTKTTRDKLTEDLFDEFMKTIEENFITMNLTAVYIIRDNDNYPVKEYNVPVKIIESEYKGAGELLRLYYFHKLIEDPDAICISIHDSVFLRNFNFNNTENYGYDIFWTCVHDFDIPTNEKPLLSKVKNNSIETNFLLSLYNNKKLWRPCFGACISTTKKFLDQVNKFTGLLSLVTEIKEYKHRVAIERITGFCFDITKRLLEEPFNNYTAFGNLHVFHHSEYTVALMNPMTNKDFSFDNYRDNKKAFNNYNVIKVWLGR